MVAGTVCALLSLAVSPYAISKFGGAIVGAYWGATMVLELLSIGQVVVITQELPLPDIVRAAFVDNEYHTSVLGLAEPDEEPIGPSIDMADLLFGQHFKGHAAPFHVCNYVCADTEVCRARIPVYSRMSDEARQVLPCVIAEKRTGIEYLPDVAIRYHSSYCGKWTLVTTHPGRHVWNKANNRSVYNNCTLTVRGDLLEVCGPLGVEEVPIAPLTTTAFQLSTAPRGSEEEKSVVRASLRSGMLARLASERCSPRHPDALAMWVGKMSDDMYINTTPNTVIVHSPKGRLGRALYNTLSWWRNQTLDELLTMVALHQPGSRKVMPWKFVERPVVQYTMITRASRVRPSAYFTPERPPFLGEGARNSPARDHRPSGDPGQQPGEHGVFTGDASAAHHAGPQPAHPGDGVVQHPNCRGQSYADSDASSVSSDDEGAVGTVGVRGDHQPDPDTQTSETLHASRPNRDDSVAVLWDLRVPGWPVHTRVENWPSLHLSVGDVIEQSYCGPLVPPFLPEFVTITVDSLTSGLGECTVEFPGCPTPPPRIPLELLRASVSRLDLREVRDAIGRIPSVAQLSGHNDSRQASRAIANHLRRIRDGGSACARTDQAPSLPSEDPGARISPVARDELAQGSEAAPRIREVDTALPRSPAPTITSSSGKSSFRGAKAGTRGRRQFHQSRDHDESNRPAQHQSSQGRVHERGGPVRRSSREKGSSR